MIFWVLVAGLGGVLSLVGLLAVFRRYGRGEVTLQYLLACLVGLVSFGSYALLYALSPDVTAEPVGLLILAPALVSIVVLVREHGRSGGGGGPRR